MVNDLLALTYALRVVPAADPDREGCVAALATRQREYTAAIEAALRVGAKLGGSAPPNNTVAVGLAIRDVLVGIHDTL